MYPPFILITNLMFKTGFIEMRFISKSIQAGKLNKLGYKS